jgi:hypothetical protein
MKASDWICNTCGSTLIKTSPNFLSCPGWDSRLQPSFAVDDLPSARRVDYKRFVVYGEEGYMEYIPHTHESSLDKCPETGVVVAKVRTKRGWKARSFQRSTRPRLECILKCFRRYPDGSKAAS